MVRTSYAYFQFIQLDAWVGKMLRDHKLLPKKHGYYFGMGTPCRYYYSYFGLWGKKPLHHYWVHIVVSIGCHHFPFSLFFSCSTVSFNWFGWHCRRHLETAITNKQPIERIHMVGTRHTVQVCTIMNWMSVFTGLTKHEKYDWSGIDSHVLVLLILNKFHECKKWNTKVKRRRNRTMATNCYTHRYVHQRYLYSRRLRSSINIYFLYIVYDGIWL